MPFFYMDNPKIMRRVYTWAALVWGGYRVCAEVEAYSALFFTQIKRSKQARQPKIHHEKQQLLAKAMTLLHAVEQIGCHGNKPYREKGH